MASLDTFDWFVRRFFPRPTDEQQAMLASEREYLLGIRNENERARYIESLMARLREEAARVSV